MELVIDGKILSIKHYLNKALSPLVEDGKTKYPLYTQVIFDKKNTRFKAIRDHLFFEKEDIYVDEKKENNLKRIIAQNIDSEIKGVISTEYRMLKIIEREITYSDDSLKGLSKKFKKYGQLLTNLIRGEAERDFLNMCKEVLIYNDYITVEQSQTMIEKYNTLKALDKYKSLIGRLETDTFNHIINIRSSILLELFEKEYGLENSTYFSWIFENGEQRFIDIVRNSEYFNWLRYKNDSEYKIFSDSQYVTEYLRYNVN